MFKTSTELFNEETCISPHEMRMRSIWIFWEMRHRNISDLLRVGLKGPHISYCILNYFFIADQMREYTKELLAAWKTKFKLIVCHHQLALPADQVSVIPISKSNYARQNDLNFEKEIRNLSIIVKPILKIISQRYRFKTLLMLLQKQMKDFTKE